TVTKEPKSRQFFASLPDEETCLAHLFAVRFGPGFECSSCGRPSNWYRIKAARAYGCQWCGHHVHPTAGTPLERTSLPLTLWFHTLSLFATNSEPTSVRALGRHLGVSY